MGKLDEKPETAKMSRIPETKLSQVQKQSRVAKLLGRRDVQAGRRASTSDSWKNN
jgi:hypothetical protein